MHAVIKEITKSTVLSYKNSHVNLSTLKIHLFPVLFLKKQWDCTNDSTNAECWALRVHRQKSV